MESKYPGMVYVHVQGFSMATISLQDVNMLCASSEVSAEMIDTNQLPCARDDSHSQIDKTAVTGIIELPQAGDRTGYLQL